MKTKFKSTITSTCQSFGGAVCAGAVVLMASSAQAQNLFVPNIQSDFITEITPSGVQSTFASELPDPNGLAFDNAGDLFVGNDFLDTISEFPAGGAPQITVASGLTGFLNGMAVNTAGDIFVADDTGPRIGSIIEITPSGVQKTFASGLNSPSGLAFNSAGKLFETDVNSGSIYEFTPGGVQTTFASGLNIPIGLAFNRAGDLFVAENVSGNIYEFTPGGARSTYATGLSSLTGIAVDSAGNLFVTVYGGDITEIMPDGAQSTFASNVGVFDPAFLDPSFLAIDPVPEPSVFGLLAVGIAALLFRRCRLAA